jgi:hypothetical protein
MDKMTANKEGSSGDFDMAAYTSAPLKLDMRIEFQGTSPADVFEVMGDPMRVKDWTSTSSSSCLAWSKRKSCIGMYRPDMYTERTEKSSH